MSKESHGYWRSLAAIAASIALLGLHSHRVAAQPWPSTQAMVFVTVPPYLEVILENKEVHFSEDEVLGGIVTGDSIAVQRDEAIRLRTRTNVPFVLLISAGTDVLVGSNGSTIPVNRLHWRAGEAGWTSLSTTPVTVRVFLSPGSEQISLDLLLVLEITDAPGLYEGEILFTLQQTAV